MTTAAKTQKANGAAPDDTPATGLYAKLAEIIAAVGPVEKNGRNDFHDYDYVLESDLLEAVRLKLAERRVVLIPSVKDVTREGSLTTVHLSFTVVDADSGESVECGWSGTGTDKGDKAIYKAYTGALKYFLMKTFLIATGTDPEGGNEPADLPQTQTIQTIDGDRVAALTDLAQAFVTASDDSDEQKKRTTKITRLLRAEGLTGAIESVTQGFARLTPGMADNVEAWLREQKGGAE